MCRTKGRVELVCPSRTIFGGDYRKKGSKDMLHILGDANVNDEMMLSTESRLASGR